MGCERPSNTQLNFAVWNSKPDSSICWFRTCASSPSARCRWSQVHGGKKSVVAAHHRAVGAVAELLIKLRIEGFA